jgi:outer membrane protein OmpA-like peptidoglycan-associated protein
MKRVSEFVFAIAGAALLLGAPGAALAQAGSPGYATSGSAGGQVWKNPYGLCWRSGGAWTAANVIAECDPDLVPKPAPRAATPAPVIQAAPVPVAPPPAPIARVVDSDGDGVPDGQDLCPDTPRGVAVGARGCELDSDGDGVLDRADKCPGTRAGARIDAAGCEAAEVMVLKGVNFATNSARLTTGSATILDDAAATLLKRGDMRMEVAGHTDDRGSAERNRDLSQQRAEAVRRYLVSKGVSAASLSARGYGEESPLADNRSESGRAANRRVELRPVP